MKNTQESRKQIRIAYADVPLEFVESILIFIKHIYDIDLVRDRDADFVFHSHGGLEVLKYPGVRIFITGENTSPNFGISDYAMAFDKLTYGDRYLWTPLCKIIGHYSGILQPKPNPAATLADKTGFCSYVMSNTTNSDDARFVIFDLLNEYKTVSSGGRWRNNVGGRVADKLAFQKQHKFAIAFENCSHPGYLTEKFTDAAASNTIPIYWGDPEIGTLFNTKAFINCHDYRSLEDVVQKVTELDQNDELYLQMLAEPWFINDSEPESLKDETITAFLSHIFDQIPDLAFRRNRGRWGIKSEKNLHDMYHRPHIQMFKNIRKRWRKLYHNITPYRKPY